MHACMNYYNHVPYSSDSILAINYVSASSFFFASTSVTILIILYEFLLNFAPSGVMFLS